MHALYKLVLRQGIGAPAKPVITMGERVQRGMLLAQCLPDELGVPLHSPVDGRVERADAQSIVIRADSRQTSEFVPIEGKSILELVRASGLVGMGGAGFPTYSKLGAKYDKPPVVIVNAVECEPVLSHNIAAIEKNPLRLYKGLRYAMEACLGTKGYIAVKAKHKKAIQALRSAITDKDIEIKTLPDRYPMGDERAVIRETLGVLLAPGCLPREAGAVVLNAETVMRITDAVELRKPVISKDMTVGGRILGDPIQIREDVPIGTTVGSLLENIGYHREDHGEIVIGGAFTGCSGSLEDPVTKTTGGILVTMPPLRNARKIGLLVCACGAGMERMERIATDMQSEIVGAEHCKQSQLVGNTRKCENPGICPGQLQKILALKKAGAETLLVGNCSDCTNTVMAVAPKLNLPVYHCTDGALRAVNARLIRKLSSNETISAM